MGQKQNVRNSNNNSATTALASIDQVDNNLHISRSTDKRDESPIPRNDTGKDGSVNTYEAFVLKEEGGIESVLPSARTPSLTSHIESNTSLRSRKDSYAGESLLDLDEVYGNDDSSDTDSSVSTMYEDPVSSIPPAAVAIASLSETISTLPTNDSSPEKNKKKKSSKEDRDLRLLSRKSSPIPIDPVSTSGSSSSGAELQELKEKNIKSLEMQMESLHPFDDKFYDNRIRNSPLVRKRTGTSSVVSIDSAYEDNVSASFTKLQRIPYVHGSFAPAAPMMLQDSRWMRILRRVMPESHADALTILCQERKSSATLVPNAVRIMKWAENNPVVAAYGIVTSKAWSKPELYSKNARPHSAKNYSRDDDANTGFRFRRSDSQNRFSRSIARALGRRSESTSQCNAPVLEWDVFLDPNLVRKLEHALRESDEQKETGDEAASIASDVEVDRLVSCLVNRMFLAHGSTSQLVSEAFGFNRKYNFASIVEQGESQRLHRRRRPTDLPDRVDSNEFDTKKRYQRRVSSRMSFLAEAEAESDRVVAPFVPGKGQAKAGGIFVERWLACFVKALQMAIEPNDHESDPWILLDELEKKNELGDADDDEFRQVKPPMCGVFLCLGYDDPNSAKAHNTKTCMAQNTAEIARLLGSPLRVVLDLKSRRIPPRVWGRLVTTLHSRGLHVDGLGSFDVDELRDIGNFVSPLVSQIIFFHSAGDLQRAIHANEVKHGDTVYFNAGSLIWNKPKSIASKLSCCHAADLESAIDVSDMVMYKQQPFFHPCAYPHKESKDRFTDMDCKSTLEDYQKKLNLNIGCYVQEFSISEQTLDTIVQHMNKYQDIYNLGLAWGGINGRTALGVLGDGYWNQRYMGRQWDMDAEPSDAMHLLNIEDHHLVKKALQTGAWAHVGMVNPVNDVGGDATGEGAQLNFEACKPVA